MIAGQGSMNLKLVLASLIAIVGLSSCSHTRPLATLSTEVLFGVKTDGAIVSYGQDLLALQQKNFQSQKAIRFSQSRNSLGILDWTFGTEPSPVVSYLRGVNPRIFRIHIINGPCIRNGNCGPYEISHGYNKASFDLQIRARNPRILSWYKSRIQLWHTISNQFPETEFIISPELEHDLSTESWRVLADATLSVWPGVRLSNSPDGGVPAQLYQNALLERHGNKNIGDANIVSLDGVDATQINMQDLLRRVAGKKLFEVWQGPYNCRIGVWQDPRVRTVCPPSSVFELLSHITDPLPPAPRFTGTQCRKIYPFTAPSIWKPISEYFPPPDKRTYLPVTITNKLPRGAPISILASNGGRVGVLGYYGSYLDQGGRWYSCTHGGDCQSGYEYQKAALAATGFPWVWLKSGPNCQGPIPTGQRWGKFD